MLSKIVRCIQNTKEGPVWMLTVGTLYEVIEEDDTGYKVKNNKLYPYWYPKYLFEAEEEVIAEGVGPVEAVDWKKVFVTEEEFEPITPKNICEVLKYNGIHSDRYYVTEAAVVVGVHLYNEKQETYHHFYFTAPNWLQHLELEVGRLSPLPKQPLTLLTYWEQNKINGVEVSDCEWQKKGRWYEFYVKHELVALIPKQWALAQQIELLQTLIKAYKGY